MDYRGIPMNGEVAGKKSTTKHSIRFHTHGTFHGYKTQTPQGGWKATGHPTSQCDNDCARAFNNASFVNLQVTTLHRFPQGEAANDINNWDIFEKGIFRPQPDA